jgi:hypothetical protein
MRRLASVFAAGYLAVLAGCGRSTTGALTGQIGLVGRVPPKSLLAENQVLVLHDGTPVARQPLHVGEPYRFSLPPGQYTIDLRGPDNTRWGNVGTVHAGGTTRMDLTLVFHGTAS